MVYTQSPPSVMKQQRKDLQTIPRLRPGDGEVLRVIKQPLPQLDGSTLLEVGFDLAEAPVPARRYIAEIAQVVQEPELVRLCFGQRLVVGKGLRSLLVLNMTPDHLADFLRSCDQFWVNVQSQVKSSGIEPIPLYRITEEPSQTVSMAVNLIAAAYASREACLDCYHISPFTFRALQHSDHIGLNPVVRIDLPTSLLYSLLKALLELRSALPGHG